MVNFQTKNGISHFWKGGWRRRADQLQLLRLIGQLPARLLPGEVADVINCQAHDIPVLVAARLLKPLGNPPPNSVKYFSSADVLERCKDQTWLDKVTNTLNQYWQAKNAAKKKSAEEFGARGALCFRWRR